MDRRENILAMGYLYKAPVKNKDKAMFGKFWKIRWLVLTEVLFVDANELIEDSKLVFSYYKDKESHAKDETPKGTLNLSNCKGIKSCFQAQANYDHSFLIEFNDGKVARFSAPSCEKKFKWISLLYKYRFGNNLETIMHALGIPGAPSNRMSHSQKRASIYSNGGPISRVRSVSAYANGNSDVFSSPGTFDSSSEEPPPLPARRPSNISTNSDISPSSPTMRSAVNPNEVDLSLLYTFNELFMLCSKCQAESQKKSGCLRKKRPSKRWGGQQEDVEVREECVASCQSSINNDNTSQFSNFSDDFFVEDPYTTIDDILLEKVRTLKELAEKANKEEMEPEDDAKNEEDICESKKEIEDVVGNATICERGSNGEMEPMDDVYMDMSQVEPNSASHDKEPSADPELAERQREDDYGGNMKKIFEMSC